MRILLTGIAGFIGFHTAKTLIVEGHEIVGVDNLNDYYDCQLKLDRLLELGIDIKTGRLHSKGLTFVQGDISEEVLWDILSSFSFDLVINLAAQAGVRFSIENPLTYIKSNVLGFTLLLEFCYKRKINKLIYASSSSVYGLNSAQPFREEEGCAEPESLYAATKRSNELLAHTYFKTRGISSIGLRFFTVYGPWGRPDMAPMLFADAASKGLPIKVFNSGKQKRDFTYIDDIVRGILACIKITFDKPIVLNIGRGAPVSLMDFIQEVESNFQIKLDKVYMPAQIGDVVETYASLDLLYSLTDYKPGVDISEGVRLFANWYKSYYRF
jgi:UDP-glucuronate 4-epimerase